MKLLSHNRSRSYAQRRSNRSFSSRVLLITDSFVPTTTSTAKLVKDLADELARRGLAVTVLVPSAFAEKPCEVSTEDGLEVIRIRTSKTKGAGKLLRGIREISFSQQIWRRARAVLAPRSFDLIIFFSPTIFFGPLVERLKKRYSDVLPTWCFVTSGPSLCWMWENSSLDLAHKYLSRFEQKQYSAADVIGVQSPGDLSYFDHDHPSHRTRVEVLFNWYSVGVEHAYELTIASGLAWRIGLCSSSVAILESRKIHSMCSDLQAR